MKIQEQSAIISGGASGLGAATAKLLASQGVRPVIIDRDAAAAKSIAEKLNGLAFACDVTDPQSVSESINLAHKEIGVSRFCVNCAGVAPAKRIVSRDGAQELADFNQVIQVNLIGTFNVMRLAAEKMIASEPLDNGERGVIINTASIAAFDGQIGQAAYSASKGGVAAMTLPAAREFAQHGIRVNTIAPGVMETPMMMTMSDKVRSSLEESVPFPKRLGRPDEFAAMVQVIIENDYINSVVMRLDAGLRMA